MYKTIHKNTYTVLYINMSSVINNSKMNEILDDLRNPDNTVYDLKCIELDINNDYDYELPNTFNRYRYDGQQINTKYVDEAIIFFENILSQEQRYIYNEIIKNVEETLLYDTKPSLWNDNRYKANHSILNAPAGTGKSLLLILIGLKVNKIMGISTGTLIFSPSYAGVESIFDKLDEVFNKKYSHEESKNAKRNVKLFLNINTTNSFYGCGSQAFNIHDQGALGKLITNMDRKNKYPSQINNIIAMRECKMILFDEAFFSTVARFQATFKFLEEAYINNNYLKHKFNEKFDSNFLDFLKFTKNIVYCGDPRQLSIGIERNDVKNPGIIGDPIWKLKVPNMSFHSTIINNITDYNCYNLKKSYRFDNETDKELIKHIENIAVPYWKGDPGFEEYKKNIEALINYMDSINLIKYKSTPENTIKHINNIEESGSCSNIRIVTEIHKTKTELNKVGCNPILKIEMDPPIHCYNPTKKTNLGVDKPISDYLNDLGNQTTEQKKKFRSVSKNEYKKGIMTHKYIGIPYPSCLDEQVNTNFNNDYTLDVYLKDLVRITYPIRNNKSEKTQQFPISRVIDENTYENLPEEMSLLTGDYGIAVGYNKKEGFILIFNKEESERYYNNINYKLDKKSVKIKIGSSYITTNNLVIAIKHSKYLDEPYLKSEFYNHPLEDKRFKLSVHCVPIAKSMASTIHSLQGKSYDKKTHVGYYMTRQITRKDLNNSNIIEDKSNTFKGNRRIFLYVAITRSRYPSTNFTLYTETNTKKELIDMILKGEKSNSYKDIHEFLDKFNKQSIPRF